MFFWRNLLVMIRRKKNAFHLHTVFVLPYALHGSGHHNVLDFSVFEGFFFNAASGPPFPENISSTFFYSKVGMDAKIDCNLLAPFPTTKTASSSHLLKSPIITLFLLKQILPHYSLARLSHWRKDCLAHDQSQNFLGHQSLPFLCSPKILYQMCCRRM